MKTVIVGVRGMLGSDLAYACAGDGHEVIGFDLPELDITDKEGLSGKIPECDWVINCAAYTMVDDAESEQEKANAVNGGGAGHVAEVCAEKGSAVLHVSTDYVFGGMSDRPYREEDPVDPINAYGISKLAGEREVQSATDDHLIVRSESLFGDNGRNFVSAISDKLTDGGDVKVVNDQTVAPTYTVHLAEAIVALMKSGRRGVVHVCASGSCTWFEFAREIAEKIGCAGLVKPISAEELAKPAKRPSYSVLDTSRYTEWTGRTMPTWREGLAEYLIELGKG